MKSIFGFIILTLIIIKSTELYSQYITRWEYIDSTDLGSGFISVNNKNDFIIWENIDKVYPSGFHYLNYEIKLYNNKGLINKIIYNDSLHGHYSDYDSVYGLDEINSLSHTSVNVIIAVGYNRIYHGWFDNSTWYKYNSLMIISTDGGNTFQRNILDSNETFGPIIMFDSLNGIMRKGETYNYFNRKYTLHDSLRITNDCWETYKCLPLPNGSSSLKAFSPDILACYKSEGLNTIFYRSSDGGKSWQNYKLENYYPPRFKFLTKDKIIGIGQYSNTTDNIFHILKSNDGGKNWRVIDKFKFRINKDNFNFNTSVGNSNFDFCDSLNGFLTLSGGSILKSTDGGESWFQEFFPFSEKYPNLTQFQESFGSIIYPSIDFAVALAKQNFVLITENKLILCPPHFYSPMNRQYKTVNNVKLSWTKIDEAKQYRFRMSGAIKESGLASFNNPDLDTLLSDTTIIINNLKYYSYYNCWIKAIADTTESDWSYESPLFWTITHEGALYPPYLIFPALNDTGIPVNTTLQWEIVPGATKYVMILYKLIDPKNPTSRELIKTDTNIVENFYSLDSTLLEPNTTYWVYLQSKNIDTVSGVGSYAFTTVSTVSVNDLYPNLNNMSLYLFPNPASDKCIIRFNSEPFNILGLKLYNSMGVELADLKRSAQLIYGNKELELDLSLLTSGVYFVIAQDRHGIYSKSFVLVK